MFKNPIINIIYIYKYVIDSLILKICVQIVATGRQAAKCILEKRINCP